MPLGRLKNLWVAQESLKRKQKKPGWKQQRDYSNAAGRREFVRKTDNRTGERRFQVAPIKLVQQKPENLLDQRSSVRARQRKPDLTSVARLILIPNVVVLRINTEAWVTGEDEKQAEGEPVRYIWIGNVAIETLPDDNRPMCWLVELSDLVFRKSDRVNIDVFTDISVWRYVADIFTVYPV